MSGIEAYIRQAAIRRNINPDVAVRVARSEGGLSNPFQRGLGPAPRSQASGFGSTEHSFGPFQLYLSGNNAGLGDRALAAGVDPRKNWQGGVDYALDEAARKGWGQWYGAAKAGIGNFDGINGAKVVGSYASSPLPNPDQRLAGDSMVPRNTHAQVEAATTFAPTQSASIWGAGDQPSGGNVADPNVAAQSQALADKEKRAKAVKGFFDALSQYPDAQPVRMSPMADARQSGGGLLEYMSQLTAGNPFANFARQQRGLR